MTLREDTLLPVVGVYWIDEGDYERYSEKRPVSAQFSYQEAGNHSPTDLAGPTDEAIDSATFLQCNS